MAENPIEDASGLLKALGISGEQLQNAKLGPGIVGRNTVIAWVFLIVMLVGILCSYGLHNNFLLTLCLIFAFIVAVGVLLLNVYFGNKNPAAALLEGAQFLQYQQFKMAARGRPVIEARSPAQSAPRSLTGDMSPVSLPEVEND